MSKNRQVRPVAIILTTIVILGAAIYAVLFAIARDGDSRQRLTEETIVYSALNQSAGKLSDTLIQNAYWDEAYDKITQRLDVEWADSRIGVYSEQTAGIPITVIYNEEGKPVYRYRAPRLAADAAALDTEPAMIALVNRALSAPPLPPRPFTGFVVVNGRVYLGVAERVVPTDTRKFRTLTRRFVLAYLVPFDAARLQRLQREYHIAPLSPARTPNREGASIALKDANGKVIAHLNWASATPGAEFASAAAPIAIGCFILIALLQLLVLRSWLRAAEKLRDEGVAKTVFLANASHELRTPLNAILGFSECMVLELYGPMNPKYKEYAADIRMSGQHLLNIVNDVLDLSQLNSPDKRTALQPLKLGAALGQPLRMLREFGKGQDVNINYVNRVENIEVVATEKALSQILLNLGSNAVKFSKPKGTVDVTVTKSTRMDWVELVVRDHGAGIPEDKLRFIGQPFFQAHTDSTKPGSGLGLAIVKTLIDRLKGEFAIQSAVGVGTTVTVRLPVHRGLREIVRGVQTAA